MAAANKAAITPMAAEGQQSLESAWEDACTAFKKAAGIDLKMTAPPGADAIRASFDAKRSKDAEKHRKMEKAKDAFSKTMICISRVGGIAASGASMVFGSPASIAGSALTFLIDVGIQYRNMFANIEDLLTRIVVVFERFQVYRDNQADLPPEMIRVANKLLIVVVKICGVCYKALTSSPLATFGKMAFFSTDRDVQAQLAELKRIESEEGKTQSTLNLVLAAENKRNLATGFEKTTEGLQAISSSVQRVQEELNEQKDLKELRKMLSIPKDAEYLKQYQHLYNKLSQESGGEFCKWLQDDAVYQVWADAHTFEHTALILSGEPGCGKTCTTTAIINDLARRYPQQQHNANRVSIAYFYLNRSGKEESKNEAGVTLSDVIRLLAWQVAQNDLFYRRDLTAICKRTPNLGTTQEMWKRLFLDSANENATFYLIVDGIHELDSTELDTFAELINMLLSQPLASLCVKLLLPSRRDFVEKLYLKLPMRLSEIRLATCTKSDVEGFIRREAGKMAIFQRETESVRKLKDDVCKGLAEAVGGSFVDAGFLLREINGKNDSREVMEVVERAKSGNGVSGSITDMIKRCNRKLGTKELQDLNTLLLWVMYGEWDFDLSECESILYLQRNGSSLKPLKNQIEHDFSDFFNLNSDEIVSLANESIRTHFKSISGKRSLNSSTSATTVSKREIKMVQNFLLKFCEDEIYEQMGLAAFFDQKLSESDTEIAVDCENAHALITIDCLRALTGDYAEEVSDIVFYVTFHLVSHLEKLDLDGVDPRYKGEIGPLLVTLLREPQRICEALGFGYFSQWSYNDRLPKEMVRVLRSSAVTRKINEIPDQISDWVTSVLSSTQSEIDLFAPMAIAMIKLWLEGKTILENKNGFTWIYGYYNKIQRIENPDSVERIDQPPSEYGISSDLIQEIFEWAITKTQIDVEAANTWRNVGVTQREYRNFDVAIELLEKALTCGSDNMFIYCNLAKAYAERSWKEDVEDLRKAIESAKRVIVATEKGEDVLEKGDANVWLIRMQIYSAEWNRDLKNWDEAEKIYHQLFQLLEKNPTFYEVVNEHIKMMCEQERWTDVVETIHGLNDQLHTPYENAETAELPQTRLAYFLREFGDDNRVRITNAFKQAGKLSEVKQHYQRVLKDMEKPVERHTNYSLNRYGTLAVGLAALLHHHAIDVAEENEAIQLWEKIVHMNGPVSWLADAKYTSCRCLSAVYVTRAVNAPGDDSDIDHMVARFEQLGVNENNPRGFPGDLVRSVIGRYFTAIGDAEQARVWLRPNVDVGVKLLCDDDTSNDYQGYRKLGDAFMDFGDLDNAIASWQMIGPDQGLELYEEKKTGEGTAAPSISSNENCVTGDDLENPYIENSTATAVNGSASGADDSSSTEATNMPLLRRTSTWQPQMGLSGPLGYSCDGGCGKSWTYVDDMYICRECIDVQFDARCFEKLQAGELGEETCSKAHRFMHLPAWTPEILERIRAGLVRVGDTELPIDEWLAKIRKEWDIEETPTKIKPKINNEAADDDNS